jgi:hypothetical protein
MPPKKLTALAVAVLLAASCSGGDDDDGKSADSTHDTAQTESQSFTKPKVTLTVTRAELVSPHQAFGPMDAKTRKAVVDVVQQLLLITSAEPLTAGKAGKGFADLFTADAGARAAGPDRAAMFDEGLPEFGGLEPTAASVVLTGLAGTMDPATGLVVAHFTWDVGSKLHTGDRVIRSGDLSLVPDGGGWKIAAYDIAVERTIDDTTTSTTATTKP